MAGDRGGALLDARGDRATRCAGALLLLIVTGWPDIRAGETRGSIGGRVTDRAGQTPIAAVRVTLRAQRQAPSPVLPASLPRTQAPDAPRPESGRGTLTDASGEYRFDEVPPGVYVLIFAGEDHAGRTLAPILLDAGSDLRVDSDLEPLVSERITVSGGGVDAGPGLSRIVLGRDAFASPPAALGDPFRAIAGRAGIAPADDFKSEMRVRGGDATETAVLLDGQPLPYAYHFGGGAGSAGALNGDLVDTVQVATGGFSVEYGDALAGVIDLSTRDARPGRATGTVGIGSMLAHAALFGPAGDGSWVFSGRFSDLGLYDERVAGDATDGVAFHDLFGALRMPFTNGGKLEVALLEAGNDYREDLGSSARAAMSSVSRWLRARLELALDPETLLRVQAADSGLSVASSVTGGESFDQQQRRQDLRISLLRILGPAHRLNGGLALERVLGGMTGSVFNGIVLLPSDLDYRADRASAFVEDIWRPADNVTLRYGARADHSSWTGESALSPRFSLEVGPGGGVTLRCAAGRFVQFPRQEQVFLAAGDPIGMQVADHLIAGFEVSSKNGTRLVVEGYRKDLKDSIGEAVNRFAELEERVTRFDSARALGAEITLERRSPGPWSWQANYAYLEATQDKEGIVSPRNTDQRHSLGLSGRRRLGRGWEAGAAFRYASGLPYTPLRPWTNGVDYGVVLGRLNGARLPAYERLDLRLERALPASWGRLGFRLDLLNVLNRPNVRSIDLTFDPSAGAFYETVFYQCPFLPVFSLKTEF